MEEIMKTKKTGKNGNNNSINNRFFSIPKPTRGLFVSSANSNESVKDIVNATIDIALEHKCNLILHAGWSFEAKTEKFDNKIFDPIIQAIKGTNIKTYIAEIEYTSKGYSDYFIIRQRPRKISITKCLPQQFSKSQQIEEADKLLLEAKSVKPKKIATNGEYPCFLMICGENNLFNMHNRGNKTAKIKHASLSDNFLSNLKRIQNRQWIMFNPSHLPYTGKQLTSHVMKFHRASSGDKRIRYVITGTNRSHGELQAKINKPQVWRNGKSKSMPIVLKDNRNFLYMHKFVLQ